MGVVAVDVGSSSGEVVAVVLRRVIVHHVGGCGGGWIVTPGWVRERRSLISEEIRHFSSPPFGFGGQLSVPGLNSVLF